MPEAPREVVAKKKVPPLQVPEVVPVKGTCLTVSFHGRARGNTGRLEVPGVCKCSFCMCGLLGLSVNILNVLGEPKEASPTESHEC